MNKNVLLFAFSISLLVMSATKFSNVSEVKGSSDYIYYYDELGLEQRVDRSDVNIYTSSNKKLLSGLNYIEFGESLYNFTVEQQGNLPIIIIANPDFSLNITSHLFNLFSDDREIKIYSEYLERDSSKKLELDFLSSDSDYDLEDFGGKTTFVNCDINITSFDGSPGFIAQYLNFYNCDVEIAGGYETPAISSIGEINFYNSTFNISGGEYNDTEGTSGSGVGIECFNINFDNSAGVISGFSGINSSNNITISGGSDVIIKASNVCGSKNLLKYEDSLIAKEIVVSDQSNLSVFSCNSALNGIQSEKGHAINESASITLNEGTIELRGSVFNDGCVSAFDNEITVHNDVAELTLSNPNEDALIKGLDLKEIDFKLKVSENYAKLTTTVQSDYIKELNTWANTYLHMLDYVDSANLCLTYYSIAKSELHKLGIIAISDLISCCYYVDFKDRYEAWALSNNDNDPYFYKETGIKMINNSSVEFGSFDSSNDLVVALIITLTGILSTYFLIKIKRKDI